MINPLSVITILTFGLLFSCNTSNTEKEKTKDVPDSSKTDEAEMPEIEEVEMKYMYEVTNTKTKKVVMMNQEEYLASGIWENPDVMIKEIPMVK